MTARIHGARSLARAVAALAAMTAPALAAPEASEVWTDLREGMESYGYAVEAGTEEVGDDAVRLEDLVLSTETRGEAMGPDGEMAASVTRITLTLARAGLAEEGDAVVVTLPEEIPVAIETEVEGADPVVLRGRLRSEGLDVAVREAGGGLRYAYASDMQAFEIDESEGSEGTLDLAIRIESFAGETLTGREGTERTTTQSQRAGRATAEVQFVDPSPDGGSIDLAFALADLVATGETRVPEGAAIADPGLTARAGGRVAGDVDYGDTRLEIAIDGPGGALDVSTTSAGGALNVSFGADGVAYGLQTEDSATRLRGEQLPVPELSYTVERTALDLLVPILAGDAPQPFRIAAALTGLDLDDAIWALFDPRAVLPRDPASLDVALSGTATVPEDLVAPAPGADEEAADGTAAGNRPEAEAGAQEDADAEPPAPSLVGIEVERLDLSAAGARLTAKGALTAVEDGTPAAPGLPPLAGTLAIDLTGVEGLLDGLVEMGLLAPERSAFARGMLGFIARPTGADAYASELQLGGDGSVTANGMALR